MLQAFRLFDVRSRSRGRAGKPMTLTSANDAPQGAPPYDRRQHPAAMESVDQKECTQLLNSGRRTAPVGR